MPLNGQHSALGLILNSHKMLSWYMYTKKKYIYISIQEIRMERNVQPGQKVENASWLEPFALNVTTIHKPLSFATNRGKNN
jgi:3-hydroxymyristoyl/3-hydroxydecanoyl-(acyl carrier protein) dehydratase